MNIKDLKIGDKVLSPNGEIITVIGMGQNVVCYGENKNILATYLEPIPLNDDILKELGFEHWNDSQIPKLSFWSASTININHFGDCDDWKVISPSGMKHIMYLHQLQHEAWDAGAKLNFEKYQS